MSTLRQRMIVAASLACLLLAASFVATPAAAGRNLTYQLYGSRSAGWGYTGTTLTIPGPSIDVEVGDNVTLNMTSTDGLTHRWYIDYNNNSAGDGSEPRSSNFGTAVRWNFTVTNVTGTYRYRSDRTAGPGDDIANMWGNITIRPAGTSSGGGANLVLIGGIVLAFVGVLAIAAYSYRRQRLPPAPPPE